MCGTLNQNYSALENFTSAKMSLLAICVTTTYSPFLSYFYLCICHSLSFPLWLLLFFFSFSISYWQDLTRETRLIYVIVHLSIEYLYHKEHNWRKYSRRSVRTVYVQVIKIVNDIWNKSYMNCGNEMKMKKWSSQWTRFMQLRKEAWKKLD